MELKLSFEILLDLEQKYGYHDDQSMFVFENLIGYTTFICDSGYFNDDNIEIAESNDSNFIVMVK